MPRAFDQPAVAAKFAAYPRAMRDKLLALRELVFDVAANTHGVGPLKETLKWGEPAYVTAQSNSGSTVRMDWKPAQPRHYAMYFHCQTRLVDSFRTLFPHTFAFAGERAIVFAEDDVVPAEELRCCIAMALTYHLRAAKR